MGPSRVRLVMLGALVALGCAGDPHLSSSRWVVATEAAIEVRVNSGCFSSIGLGTSCPDSSRVSGILEVRIDAPFEAETDVDDARLVHVRARSEGEATLEVHVATSDGGDEWIRESVRAVDIDRIDARASCGDGPLRVAEGAVFYLRATASGDGDELSVGQLPLLESDLLSFRERSMGFDVFDVVGLGEGVITSPFDASVSIPMEIVALSELSIDIPFEPVVLDLPGGDQEVVRIEPRIVRGSEWVCKTDDIGEWVTTVETPEACSLAEDREALELRSASMTFLDVFPVAPGACRIRVAIDGLSVVGSTTFPIE